MLDEFLLNIIRGTDTADEEDVFLRVSLAFAFRERCLGEFFDGGPASELDWQAAAGHCEDRRAA